MNANRRKELQKVWDSLCEIEATLESLRDDEQDYLDNIPENLQSSERYEIAESAVDSLDSALSSLEEAMDYIDEAKG